MCESNQVTSVSKNEWQIIQSHCLTSEGEQGRM